MRDRKGRRRITAVAAGVLAVVLFYDAPPLSETTARAETPAPSESAVLPPPTGVEVGTRDQSAVVSWESAEPAALTIVEWSPYPTFVPLFEQAGTDELSVLSGLTAETTYYLRVRASLEGSSSVSDTVSFTTPSERFPVAAPELKVDSETSRSLKANWTKAPAGSRYELQFSTDESFAEAETIVVDEPEKELTKLDRKPTYHTRVRAVNSLGSPISDWSEVNSRETASYLPLRVGSYNILKYSRANWKKRRHAVARTIIDQKVAVVGLQEATPVHIGGRRQYNDLARLLGSDWALTDYSKGAGEVRTAYDKTQVKLIENGAHAITGSTRFGTQRYVTWAIFEQLSTEKRFLFINTHFANPQTRKGDAHRASSARQLVDVVKRVNTDDLPVVIVGDFNTGKHRTAGNGVYRTITGAGYVDPLASGSKLGTAEKKIRADLRTANKLRRKPARDSWSAMIDHIFVSKMKVSEWETVAKLDGSGRFVGVIPSDHNMIRTTVYLP